VIAGFLSGIGEWGAVWFLIAIILFIREEERDHWFFAPFIFSAAFGWILSEVIIKWIVARPRPSETIGAIILTNPGNYSFPSTHATLAWAMAFLLSKEEPKLSFWFYLLAILISLSRIYLGVHYPSDVIGGALLGWGIGLLAMRIELSIRPRKRKRGKS
jgi:undecaprenyl-diphosphatase